MTDNAKGLLSYRFALPCRIPDGCKQLERCIAALLPLQLAARQDRLSIGAVG